VAATRLLRVAATLCALGLPLLASGQPGGQPAASKKSTEAAQPAQPAESAAPEYLLAAGDVIKISVFQNPDLTLETRVGDDGTINYPLIGTVPVGGSSIQATERKIEKSLRDGGFIVAPQVTITVVQVRGNQVTVLGQVGKPGRYPLESTDARLSEVLALAGGISPTGADTVVLTGVRAGRPIREEIDILNLAAAGSPASQVRLQSGDMIFVNRAPNFYIYGEVQKPGVFRLERGMTVMQALATGGGLTPKGTRRGLQVHRRGSDGKILIIEPKLDDPILADDVIYVRESIF
jgi:polysaccharide export outer membrane protein